jgi:hypothetical protein
MSEQHSISARGEIRRIVTGHNEHGQSIFIKDGLAPHVYQRTAESVCITELWQTRSSPAENGGWEEATDQPLRLQPPPNGTVFRIISFLPNEQQKAGLAEQQARGDDGTGIVDALNKATASRAPGFHATDTTDYVIVLSGEICALMDEGELLLRTGDVLVQRATNHAWINRSARPAVLAFVLIDAVPLAFPAPCMHSRMQKG